MNHHMLYVSNTRNREKFLSVLRLVLREIYFLIADTHLVWEQMQRGKTLSGVLSRSEGDPSFDAHVCPRFFGHYDLSCPRASEDKPSEKNIEYE